MESGTFHTESREQYDVAHAMHYKTKNLQSALRLYQEIIATYPESLEAKYSRSQIQNIVISTIPAKELFDAQVEMALAKFELENRAD